MSEDYYKLITIFQDVLSQSVSYGLYSIGLIFFAWWSKEFLIKIFRGLMVKFSSEFREGDILTIDGMTGEIVSKGGMKLTLRTSDGNYAVFPISVLFDKPYVRHTSDKRTSTR